MSHLRLREAPTITNFEIEQMQTLRKEAGEETLSQIFCEKLARKFSRDTGRAGKPAIQWKEVQSWCQTKYQASHPPVALKVEVAAPTDASVSKSEPAENFSLNPAGKRLQDISELRFEAKSSKDEAWYDVAFFLNHRVLSSGEFEVLARFVGFGKEEDEWVNVKKAVRERSIPVEPSECEKVQVGDLVLCFQERKDQALYFDAHIVEIRRSDDISGCSCVFLVRFDHDNSEESVGLTSICRRPS